MVTSVLPYTAETAGNRQALGSPRNATPRNSKPLSKANVLSSMSRITRILSPICGQTQLHLADSIHTFQYNFWKITNLIGALTWYFGALLHCGKFPLTSPLWSRLLSTKFQPQLWSSLPSRATYPWHCMDARFVAMPITATVPRGPSHQISQACLPSEKPILPRAPSVLWAMGLRCRVKPFFFT